VSEREGGREGGREREREGGRERKREQQHDCFHFWASFGLTVKGVGYSDG